MISARNIFSVSSGNFNYYDSIDSEIEANIEDTLQHVINNRTLRTEMLSNRRKRYTIKGNNAILTDTMIDLKREQMTFLARPRYRY